MNQDMRTRGERQERLQQEIDSYKSRLKRQMASERLAKHAATNMLPTSEMEATELNKKLNRSRVVLATLDREANEKAAMLLELDDVYSCSSARRVAKNAGGSTTDQSGAGTGARVVRGIPKIRHVFHTRFCSTATHKMAQNLEGLKSEVQELERNLLTMEKENAGPLQVPEREMYLRYMAKLPVSTSRRPFGELAPIGSQETIKSVIELAERSTARPVIFLRKRTIWCTQDRMHALGFAPTEIFHHAKQRWVPYDYVSVHCGRDVQLIVEEETELFYAGLYRVHSMRELANQGTPCPTDVDLTAMFAAMGLKVRLFAGSRALLHDRIREICPDQSLRPPAECFGLQCVGFDEELYQELRTKWGMSGGNGVEKQRGGASKRPGEHVPQDVREWKRTRWSTDKGN
ncbi:hypothetical protein MKEN_01340500 [Mycena kentingensis (nom. inval.)]|nr:hypothetical protein MKEN_01340500 [Mycena kentingensis (nom. inval.)]